MEDKSHFKRSYLGKQSMKKKKKLGIIQEIENYQQTPVYLGQFKSC